MEERNKHYDNTFYQRTVEIQRRCQNGMEAEELYRREADWALESANIYFKPEDRILDLACGQGFHAQRIAERTGAHVDACDLSSVLLEAASSRIENSAQHVRDMIEFRLGDMVEIKKAVEAGRKYKMITILGSSFIYFRSRKRAIDAFRDYLDLLEPEGKIVLQFRDWNGQEPDPQKMDAEWNRLGVRTEGAKPNTTKKKPMHGKIHRDVKNNDGFYVYLADAEQPLDGVSTLITEPGQAKIYRDEFGVEHSAFGRSYIDPSGIEHDLGVTQSMDWIDERSVRKALLPALEDAGFINITLSLDPQMLGPSEIVKNWAVVGEKSPS